MTKLTDAFGTHFAFVILVEKKRRGPGVSLRRNPCTAADGSSDIGAGCGCGAGGGEGGAMTLRPTSNSGGGNPANQRESKFCA